MTKELPKSARQVYALNRTQLTGVAVRIGVKHPENFLLGQLRGYVVAALRRRGEIQS